MQTTFQNRKCTLCPQMFPEVPLMTTDLRTGESPNPKNRLGTWDQRRIPRSPTCRFWNPEIQHPNWSPCPCLTISLRNFQIILVICHKMPKHQIFSTKLKKFCSPSYGMHWSQRAPPRPKRYLKKTIFEYFWQSIWYLEGARWWCWYKIWSNSCAWFL